MLLGNDAFFPHALHFLCANTLLIKTAYGFARKLTFTFFLTGFLALKSTSSPLLVVNETSVGFLTVFSALKVTLFRLIGLFAFPIQSSFF